MSQPAPVPRESSNVSFERMYREHAQAVRSVALSVVQNRHEVEDVAQTAFLNAYRALLRGNQPREPRAWLLAIAQNTARRHVRDSSRRSRAFPFDPELAESLPEQSERSASEIRSALEQLAPRQREVLILRELQGLSYAELEERLELPPETLQALLFRARRNFRDFLEGSTSPLTCYTAEELIHRQLDGEASQVHRKALKTHLRACASCSRVARSVRAQRSRVRPFTLISLPSSLVERVASLLSHGADTPSLLLKVAAGASAVALTGGVVVGQIHTSTPSLRSPSRPAEAHPVRLQAASLSYWLLPSEHVTDRGAGALSPPLLGNSKPAPVAPPPVHPVNPPIGDQGPTQGATTASSDAPAPNPPDTPTGNPPAAATPVPSPSEPSSPAPGTGSATSPATSSHGNGAAHGQAFAPGQTGTTPPGLASAPGQTGATPPGQETAPGQTGTTPPGLANAPGQTGATPPGQETAPGQTGVPPPGRTNAPDQTGVPPPGRTNAPDQTGVTAPGYADGPPPNQSDTPSSGQSPPGQLQEFLPEQGKGSPSEPQGQSRGAK